MSEEKVQAGRFENTRVYIHRRSRKQGRRVDGRYVRVGGVFKLGTPSLKSLQFLGVHKHLFMTISYPDYIRGVLDVAADLPGRHGLGYFTWVNTALKCKVLNKDLWYFIPTSVWGYRDEEHDKIIKTYSTLRILKGIGGGDYYLLNLPLITRKYLRARYKSQWKKKEKTGQEKNPAKKS
jgi:hypothetical protein